MKRPRAKGGKKTLPQSKEENKRKKKKKSRQRRVSTWQKRKIETDGEGSRPETGARKLEERHSAKPTNKK